MSLYARHINPGKGQGVKKCPSRPSGWVFVFALFLSVLLSTDSLAVSPSLSPQSISAGPNSGANKFTESQGIWHGFTNLEPVSDEQLNAQKLFLGRINLWTYKIPGLRTVCELAGVDHNDFIEVYHLRKIDVSIAFSKKTSDSIVQKWKKAFDEMLADGTIRQIRRRWNDKLPDDPFPEIND